MSDYIAIRRIEIKSTGQLIDRFQVFPSGLDVDYEYLLRNRFILSFEDFQKFDPQRCDGCGN